MNINRREFLKLAGINVAALFVPPYKPGLEFKPFNWPSLSKESLPSWIGLILEKTPNTTINRAGYLSLFDDKGFLKGKIPLAPTYWNIERSGLGDRLLSNVPWGIVLHWYGDKDNFDKTVAGYLRGFDSIRPVDDYFTRTSAHFLVADGEVKTETGSKTVSGILQTQAPDKDGTPFLASHLMPLDYLSHLERKQYFVRALYQLSFKEPAVHSILQDFFDGPVIDPNQCTIAIEITGYDFEKAANLPQIQKISNVVSVVWAIMKRYNISGLNILGHHEIQLGKADPGKKFLALIRYLIGVKALIDQDQKMINLVFGPFVNENNSPQQAVQKYFKFIRDYLMLVGRPQQVYEWEALCGYWLVFDAISTQSTLSISTPVAQTYRPPLSVESFWVGNHFLNPENHEGVDLHCDLLGNRMTGHTSFPVQLIAEGKCIYVGESMGNHPGKLAMFRHRQTDGAEIVSVFGHIYELNTLNVGEVYPLGYPIGNIESHKNHPPFLHLAIAYGATWDLDLQKKPDIPLNAGNTWIRERFIEPNQYLQHRLHYHPGQRKNDYKYG